MNSRRSIPAGTPESAGRVWDKPSSCGLEFDGELMVCAPYDAKMGVVCDGQFEASMSQQAIPPQRGRRRPNKNLGKDPLHSRSTSDKSAHWRVRREERRNGLSRFNPQTSIIR